MRNFFNFVGDFMKSRQIKKVAKRLANFQEMIAKYEAENTFRMERWNNFNSDGFTHGKTVKRLTFDFLTLKRINQVVIYRDDAKKIFAQYLCEEVDDTQLRVCDLKVRHEFYSKSHIRDCHSCWVYKHYLIMLGANSCLGYFDNRLFSVSNVGKKFKAPLVNYWASESYYARFYAELSLTEAGDLEIKSLGFREEIWFDDRIIKNYPEEPSLKILFDDIEKYRTIRAVEF